MYVTPQGQLIIFLLSGLCGICVGVFYDLFKILRRLTKTSVTAANIQDGVFWVIAAVGVFIFLLTVDNGQLRYYQLITIFTFWLIYALTVSRCFVRAGAFIISKTLLVIFMPIRLICRLIGRPVFVAISFSRRRFRQTGLLIRSITRKWKNGLKNFKKICKKT